MPKSKKNKGKASTLFDFLKISSASGGIAPQTPLVNSKCIYFHITCTSRLTPGKKMWQLTLLLLINLPENC